MRSLFLFVSLIFCCCSVPDQKPICEEQKAFGTFGNLTVPYSGYYNLDSALSCSKQTGCAVLAIYGGYNSVSDFHTMWGALLDNDVKQIVDRNIIIAYLNCEDRTALPSNGVQSLDSNIKTVGNFYAQQQIDKYKSNAQPLYVLLNSNGDTLTSPISYTPIKDKDRFIAFLNGGLNNWH